MRNSAVQKTQDKEPTTMKFRLFAIATACLVGAGSLVWTANGQQDSANNVNTDTQLQPGQQQPLQQQPLRQQTTRSGAGAQIGQLDEQTSGANVRASQLIGMDIQNSQGEDVGEIHDLVIDGNSGQVKYAAVSYGGFLGVGDKLFAVPFEAFKVRRQADDDEYMLTLNVTQQQLEGAQGFDDETWPDFANRDFTRDVDRRYGIDRSRTRNETGDRVIEGTADRTDIDVNERR
jgi:sporulation protein YlmC with PRC-barrel domain